MSKRILIVDDIDFIIEFEEKVIDSLSKDLSIKIQVDKSNNVKDTLANIAKHHYDAMVIDINLPDGSGIDIAKSAQEKSKDTRIAALTIYPQQYEEQNIYFDAFFKKPILPTSYKQHIRRLLHV